MDDFQSLSHTKWECKYHVVFIPKYRRKVLYGHLRKHLGEVIRKLAEQKQSRIEEGHLMAEHVHMMIAIHVARTYGERKRNFVGKQFWARGYFVSTVGRDEQVIREYIWNQEREDRRIDQLNLDYK